MTENNDLLTDEQMIHFITKGYVVLRNELPEQLHRKVMSSINYAFQEEGNPGNNILPRVPEIQQFFETPVVKGALTSLLGPDYYMHPHRHCHFNKPGNPEGQWHKDGFWSSMRSHRPWWAMIFYYTQDVTEELGPTAIMPGTQYYEKFVGDRGETLLPTGKAGTMVLVHFDLWHKASLNFSQIDRYMLKFQFVRLHASTAPSWNHQSAELKVPAGLPAEHLNLWQDVWNWLRGESTMSGIGAAADALELQRLEQALASEDASVRGRAADELGLIGEAAGSCAPALGKLLADPAETTALNAAYALGHMGEQGIAELIRQLSEGKTQVAERAAYGLQGAGAAAVPGLVGLLKHSDEKKAAFAAYTLGMIGPDAGEGVPALIEAAKADSEWLRRNAVESLGMVAEPAELVVPALAEELTASLKAESTPVPERSGDSFINMQRYIANKIGYTAALSLLRAGKNGESAQVIRALEDAMGSKDRYVRAYAMEALTHLQSKEAMNVLIRYYRTARWCPDTNKASSF
ncbi:HEAT repeat domain-containing protein [Paenibacillus spongiae]|uniref:HEAT repeat domain-containing protein n=1 Tax=Paenibacillus spongiae TaxID=2909671 RepID=A0ABY5SED9_9BACL|nr:HEAT repeat domain-containing protein [Paenibacillus spongiae]UVI31053.1 HEAT repeat domain-containing protein [Paenibacillus spongiae]